VNKHFPMTFSGKTALVVAVATYATDTCEAVTMRVGVGQKRAHRNRQDSDSQSSKRSNLSAFQSPPQKHQKVESHQETHPRKTSYFELIPKNVVSQMSEEEENAFPVIHLKGLMPPMPSSLSKFTGLFGGGFMLNPSDKAAEAFQKATEKKFIHNDRDQEVYNGVPGNTANPHDDETEDEIFEGGPFAGVEKLKNLKKHRAQQRADLKSIIKIFDYETGFDISRDVVADMKPKNHNGITISNEDKKNQISNKLAKIADEVFEAQVLAPLRHIMIKGDLQPLQKFQDRSRKELQETFLDTIETFLAEVGEVGENEGLENDGENEGLENDCSEQIDEDIGEDIDADQMLHKLDVEIEALGAKIKKREQENRKLIEQTLENRLHGILPEKDHLYVSENENQIFQVQKEEQIFQQKEEQKQDVLADNRYDNLYDDLDSDQSNSDRGAGFTLFRNLQQIGTQEDADVTEQQDEEGEGGKDREEEDESCSYISCSASTKGGAVAAPKTTRLKNTQVTEVVEQGSKEKQSDNNIIAEAEEEDDDSYSVAE
jgi:hypothetical protein